MTDELRVGPALTFLGRLWMCPRCGQEYSSGGTCGRCEMIDRLHRHEEEPIESAAEKACQWAEAVDLRNVCTPGAVAECWGHLRRLSKEWRKEHTDDDKDPVSLIDDSWLRSIGAAVYNDPVVRACIRSNKKDMYPVVIEIRVNGKWHVNGCKVPGSTKGEFRRLCRAIGIELKGEQ